MMFNERARVGSSALAQKIPTMGVVSEEVLYGLLLSYGQDFPDYFRRAAAYVDKILKGAKPGDLPVEQPTRFKQVINLKTARALGITVPPSLLIRGGDTASRRLTTPSVKQCRIRSPPAFPGRPGLPDIPPIAETAPGFAAVIFYGISAPKDTPPEIVEVLNKAVGEALKDAKLVARLAEIGGQPMPMTPSEFGKLISDETEKWRKVVEFAGVSVE
jgi:hypothetical protein